MRSPFALPLVALASASVVVSACGSKKESSAKESGFVRATGGLMNLSVAPLSTLRKTGSKLVADDGLSLVDAALTEGFGHYFSLAQVDGLKVKLLNVVAGSGVAPSGIQKTVFDWSKSPKEVEIRSGLNEALKESGSLDAGRYAYFSVNVQNGYSLKAFAYHDVDDDGAIEATDELVYTTASGVKTAAGDAVAGTLPDYDYYASPFLYSHNSGSGPSASVGFINVLAEPLTVKAGDILSASLLIDSYRVVGSYNGRMPAGDYSEGWGPFNSANLGSGKTWAMDKPAFALQYLPMYAFVKVGATADADAGLRAESYVMTTDPNFAEETLQLATFIFDGTGKPYAASTSISDGNSKPNLGSKFGLFSKDASGAWAFYDGAATGKGARKPEWDDGGFYYDSTKAEKAMHKTTGFMFLDTVGAVGVAKIQNAPRCWNEYRYCFPYDNTNPAVPNDGPGSGTGDATDTAQFDIHYKRVK